MNIVKNVKYKMLWAHLFSRNKDEKITLQSLNDQFVDREQKIKYLSEKFRSLREYRTLYIIAYPFRKGEKPSYIPPDKKTLKRLYGALEKMRGNSNFSILYCTLEKKFSDFSKVYVRTILSKENAEHHWFGDDASWDKALFEFPFSADKLTRSANVLENTVFDQ